MPLLLIILAIPATIFIGAALYSAVYLAPALLRGDFTRN